MISRNELPLNLFRGLPLSINAELTFALYSSTHLVLYDVYNPSYRHGGQLNVTYMGSWKNNGGLNIELNQYKYKRRGNLNGLALNYSIVVISVVQNIKKSILISLINYELLICYIFTDKSRTKSRFLYIFDDSCR